jgi:hypothetical protein
MSGRPPAAQLRAGGWCAQRKAELSRSKWRLNLGILSGGRIRVCMGQLMGWQKMGQTAHVIFFSFYFSLLFFGLVLLDYISRIFYIYILVRRRLPLRLTA